MRYITLNITILFLLAACASPPQKLAPAEKQLVYQQTQAQLRTIRSWEMQGRINIYHRGRSDTLTVTWLEEPTAYGIKLTGPLGYNAVFLLGDENGVTYKDSHGIVDTAPTPESLMQVYTGYDLPISNLRYWVLGQPVPNQAPEIKLNPQGFVIEMQQCGWHVTYQHYRQYGEYFLPTKVLLKHPDDFRVTISIHDWDMPQ